MSVPEQLHYHTTIDGLTGMARNQIVQARQPCRYVHIPSVFILTLPNLGDVKSHHVSVTFFSTVTNHNHNQCCISLQMHRGPRACFKSTQTRLKFVWWQPSGPPRSPSLCRLVSHLTWRRDLSDRQRLANQRAQTSHTSLSTTSFTRQF